MVPFTSPGGNPVTDVPGLSPTSPLMVVAPVFVTVDPARTAKLAAVPRGTGVAALAAQPWPALLPRPSPSQPRAFTRLGDASQTDGATTASTGTLNKAASTDLRPQRAPVTNPEGNEAAT